MAIMLNYYCHKGTPFLCEGTRANINTPKNKAPNYDTLRHSRMQR